MKTIEISKENAITAHSQATEKGKKLLENLLGKNVFAKNIRDVIQNIDDVFELNKTTKKEFEKKWQGFAPHEIGNALEVLIVAAYNEGILPDYTDGSSKYYPYFKMGSASGAGFSYDGGYDCWSTLSSVGSRLCFVGPEARQNMLDAVSKFLPEYKQSRTT